MEREAALELTNEWWELPGVNKQGGPYDRMGAAVREFLPDSVERGSAAEVDGKPAVVAFDTSSLFVVRVELGPTARPIADVIVSRYPLVPDDTAVSVFENVEPQTGALVRHWTFTLGGHHAVKLRTYVRRNTDWGPPISDSELFARALAQHVGWGAPFERQR